uniref:Uncharacterized protein n=1 Tax=Lepeophtheirus salmonis TaxID=72036 RepID=A0A0K2T7X4_LEPSM
MFILNFTPSPTRSYNISQQPIPYS